MTLQILLENLKSWHFIFSWSIQSADERLKFSSIFSLKLRSNFFRTIMTRKK